MPIATLVIGSPQWLWPAIALAAAGLLLLAWGYWRVSVDGWVRGTAATLKLLGFAALASILVEPLWSGTRPTPGANLFVVLADNSQSLGIHDSGRRQSRGESLRELLTDQKAPWQVRLNQDFEVRRYRFDGRLESSREFTDLAFDGQASALNTSLETIAQRFAGRPLASVLLFSDGNATDQALSAKRLAGLPPVYPVIVGDRQPARDLTIEQVTVSQTSFEDAPVTIQVQATGHGYAGESVAVRLLDEEGETVEQQQQKLAEDGKPLIYRFQLQPKNLGVVFYQVQLSVEDGWQQFENAKASREATLANNTRQVLVDRDRGPYRILYVAGRPNWEFKFLRRAVEDDEQIELVGQVRIARREPKFDFRSRAGESNNPLFRGFGKEDEDAERYDQPVIVRLGTRDDAELRDGFPKTPEDLYAYHALIFDDLEAEFFTRDQMSLIDEFVSQRGGGFLMLGGQESFQQGEFTHTPIADLLPVYLDRPLAAEPQEAFRLSLSREGWLQPWVRLRDNEADERQRIGQMPAFQTLNRVERIKPGASVLATVEDTSGTRHPALVVQRYGRGRAAALAIGDAWRWALREDEGQKDLPKAWRQMLRWLVADVPQRIEAEVERDEASPQGVMRIAVRVRDPAFKPQDNAQVTLEIQQPGAGDVLRLHAEAALSEAGLYEISYVPRTPGAYRAEVTVADEQGEAIGNTETGWTADPAAQEFRALEPNRDLLERVARQTGGELVRTEDLESFTSSLSSRKLPLTEPALFPLWHQPLVFLFALLCLVGEWGLRRWKGLA